MSFTAQAWARSAGIRAAIGELPFLRDLADGTLAPERFRHYQVQDWHYLGGYARALATAAAHSPDPADTAFWAESALTTVLVERQAHAQHLAGEVYGEASPTTAAYLGFVLSLVSDGGYPTLTAGLLPCFWAYQDVGARLAAQVTDLASHPYGAWISAYADPAFALATARARGIVDRVAAQAPAAGRERMAAAFHRAMQYEWMFWDAAFRRETWPI